MENLEHKHSIPTSLQILLSELDFLGQIKRNTKPCISGRVLVESDSFTGALYRFLKGENRNNIIAKVEQVFSQTVDAIEANKNTEHIKIIINYSAKARDGVSSLMDTYSNDPDFKAKLKVQIDNIDLQLNRFRNLIKGNSSESDQEKKYDLNTEVENLDSQESFIPGLNGRVEGINLLNSNDSNEISKRKIRKDRIKRSLEKEKDN
jgi:hypothetical protein